MTILPEIVKWSQYWQKLNTMLISEGIYLSSTQNREVTADEVRQHSVSTAIKV